MNDNQNIGRNPERTPRAPANQTPDTEATETQPTGKQATETQTTDNQPPENEMSRTGKFESTSNAESHPTQHAAGLFDIRTVIGSLLLIYGVILLAMGLFADPRLDLTGGVNANLWAGVALLTAGGVFAAWAKARPVIVDESKLPNH